jgi:hypothetical protein
MVGLVDNNVERMKGSGCGLFQDTTLAFAWRDRRKSRKPAFLTNPGPDSNCVHSEYQLEGFYRLRLLAHLSRLLSPGEWNRVVW